VATGISAAVCLKAFVLGLFAWFLFGLDVVRASQKAQRLEGKSVDEKLEARKERDAKEEMVFQLKRQLREVERDKDEKIWSLRKALDQAEKERDEAKRELLEGQTNGFSSSGE